PDRHHHQLPGRHRQHHAGREPQRLEAGGGDRDQGWQEGLQRLHESLTDERSPGRVSEFLQQLVNGVTWGSVYALIALGYTMVYGILRLINFAHGDVYMLGAFVGLYASRWLHAGESPSPGRALLVLLVSMWTFAVIGMVIER